MRKKKILLIDYIGNCNHAGEPIGHPMKVLKEYTQMLNDTFSLEVAAPKAILTMQQDITEQIMLPYAKKIIANQRTLDKVKAILNEYGNIKIVLSASNCDICIFYNVDWIFYLYLLLHRKSKTKLICVSYLNTLGNGGTAGRIKNAIMRRGIRKLDCVFHSIPQFDFCVSKLYIPDYFYEKEKYEKYLQIEKQQKVVCLGTMNHMKRLKEIVKLFCDLDYKLEIIGEFQEKDLLLELNALKTPNIMIKDQYLLEDEYLFRMAEAKYSIIPYDVNFYSGRTSGVLIENVFVNTVPIAQNEILKNNDVQGIGYEDLNCFEIPDLCALDTTELVSGYDILRKTRFDRKLNQNKIQRVLYEI